jgi:hypothetical protein
MNKMGNDLCFNPDKYYIKTTYFLGLCIDYCPYSYYTPIYDTFTNSSYNKYDSYISSKKCIKCPEMFLDSSPIKTSCYDVNRNDYF